ncbi:MAG: glutamine--fructose-6-phosphate transaminase (isomerizing) [Roseburia hominis]|uniref:glutamine--fructose-6-phosphate transaminase (isomerizing) n=1 Tax=Roseburia hominis TaxID=301301 RepID=UPI0026EB74E7|nr:glutamine--fructose-6-phosphate transaminase (isomerizing) [Roseburia hominis]MCI7522854.1 glutamine--fructose-6-phosphate transaminase (isomerizing) [Roseburia hominis]MDD6242476.1 glutamine--fructose-6-phosphate transaminase (isomerizing) [Roseburia hominis]
MCGIIGYTGSEDVREVLLDALELLEYRGYDSAGIALRDEESGKTEVRKCAGRVSDLRAICASEKVVSQCGIGHTRWATHGGVNDCNAHPHQVGKVTLVHNGIIENYRELIADYDLADTLKSETDSEVVAALLNRFYEGNPEEAIKKTVSKLKGTFALVILFEDQKDVIYSTRNVSPIVATICKEGAMLASDLTALCRFTNRYFVVPEYHILKLSADKLTLTDFDGNEVLPKYLTVDWELNSAGKNGYPFYMEKEIMEQPEAIENTIKNRIVGGMPDFTADGVPDTLFTECEHICIVACGTAMHAGLVAQTLVKSILHMHIEVQMASEFMYSDPVIDDKTLVIAVSQSGETIDTLEAVKYAKNRGAKCLAIINVKGSSIARESDYVLYTNAGPEIAVASTKAYTTQLAVFYLIVARMAHSRGVFDDAQTQSFVRELQRTPEVMKKVLERRRDIHVVAKKVLGAKDLFMIGRGLDYSILLEGSLKLKEVSYIHSEAYASGELKHGPIALITQDTPVVATVTQEKLMSKELSNIKEVKSRGADVVVFIKESIAGDLAKEYEIFTLPDMQDEFMVLPASVALQLLAYYVSSDKGFDVDKPRNLAKVVTVE